MQPRPTFEGQALDHLAEAARLPLGDERRSAVGGALAQVLALVDQLDDLELDEAPPATAFDARWREGR